MGRSNIVKKAETSVPIEGLLATRWSSYSFDPETPIDKDILISLFEAARWAPSCYNEQPWRYVIFNKHTDSAAWERALHCLVEGNRHWAQHAPVLVAAAYDSKFSANDKTNRWAGYDTGAASENICLQATSHGLAVHQMGGFDAARLREELCVPLRFEPIVVIALGYPGSPELLEEKKKSVETSSRNRRPLETIVFANRWNESFTESIQ